VISQQFGGQPNLVLLVHSRAGSVDGATATAAGGTLTTRLQSDSGVTGVVSYLTTHAPALRSHDGTEALVLARVQGDDKQHRRRSPRRSRRPPATRASVR
jgi:RND superfamily putative drug exporter